MPSQQSVRMSRKYVRNQVGFTYSPTAQTFIWCESFKREKLARPTLRRNKSIISGLNTM